VYYILINKINKDLIKLYNYYFVQQNQIMILSIIKIKNVLYFYKTELLFETIYLRKSLDFRQEGYDYSKIINLGGNIGWNFRENMKIMINLFN